MVHRCVGFTAFMTVSSFISFPFLLMWCVGCSASGYQHSQTFRPSVAWWFFPSDLSSFWNAEIVETFPFPRYGVDGFPTPTTLSIIAIDCPLQQRLSSWLKHHLSLGYGPGDQDHMYTYGFMGTIACDSLRYRARFRGYLDYVSFGRNQTQ